VEISVLIRIWLTAAAVVACLLTLIGLVELSARVLVTWVVLTLITGAFVGLCIHGAVPGGGRAVRGGAASAGGLLLAALVTVGLVAVLGTAAVVVVALALTVAGVWVWRHGLTWLTTATSARIGSEPGASPLADPSPPPLPDTPIGAVSTTRLCLAWQRSYWLLRELGPGPRRDEVVNVRGELLDELERRDPEGFGRWLHAGPRACSDPGRYLAADL
jgi:hypothetical protein